MEATIDIRTADGNVNILLEDKQVGSIREVLVDLCLSTHAIFAMLIDAAGRVVATGGETGEYELEAIAALSAGDLATSRQLAGMLSEPEFSLLFQHEKQKNLFMTAIENDAILIVVFDVDTTFGALRLRIRRSISQLQSILHQAKRSTIVALSSTADVSAEVELHSQEVDELMAVSIGPAAPAGAAAPVSPGVAAPPASVAGVPVAEPAPAVEVPPAEYVESRAVPSATPAEPEQPAPARQDAAPPEGAPPPPVAEEVEAASEVSAAPSASPPTVEAAPQPAPGSPPALAVPTVPSRPSVEAPPVPTPAEGLPAPLVSEIGKALAWFESFRGWKTVFADEVEFLSRGLARNRPEEAETLRSIFLRTRARLTEQKRLLEARFRLIQSLYQQFVVALQIVMSGAWHDEIVDRAMKAAFSGVGSGHNMVGTGIQKRDGSWSFDFALIGKQLVTVCHAQGWTYHQGMIEVLHQLNAALSALSAFIIEDAKLRDELTRQWARLYRHYADGLKTLELEGEVLDLFRPLVKSGNLPK